MGKSAVDFDPTNYRRPSHGHQRATLSPSLPRLPAASSTPSHPLYFAGLSSSFEEVQTLNMAPET